MNLIPLGQRVIVIKPVAAAANTSQSGILLSPGPAEVDNESNIVAIGDEVTSVKVGDVVVYPKYGFTEISEEDQDYFIIDEADLIAKRIS